jgi:hypothetical protein
MHTGTLHTTAVVSKDTKRRLVRIFKFDLYLCKPVQKLTPSRQTASDRHRENENQRFS